MKKFVLYIIALLLCTSGFSQRVGVVFSGGGATGFAHIGVLKALEENDIPIDFITGTSAGALIGAMYASGYSPWEIEKIVLDEKFQLMSAGRLEEDFQYVIHKPDHDAELMSIRIAKDSVFQKSLPTNILNPTFLDLEILNFLGNNLGIGGGSFDSLFVPFRCVASNIATKESILFKNGNLNEAVRASMTYPFFISPIEIDGTLMFDGGLYNNFPAEEMYSEFDPDFIIGCNVSYNEAPPEADDLMSQIRNMFSSHSNYGLPCESGIIIEPELGDIGTFDFAEIEQAIQIGYEAALEKIDSIKSYVSIRVTREELQKSRNIYKKKKTELKITNIVVRGVDENERKYLNRKLINSKKNEALEYPELKKRYLRLYQSEHILSMFPKLYPITDSTQELVIDFRKEKAFKAAFGGHYSSKPVNTGFLSLSYSDFKVTPITIFANTYFGKFYGSVKTGIKFYLPTKTTSYIEPVFVMNRWDYFKSFATFFEDSKPSFLVLNERFWSIHYRIPTSSKTKLSFDFTNGSNENAYYQTDNFTQIDTTDNTKFLYYSPGVEFVIDKLNRKQFESAGSRLSLKARFIHGIETTVPGSTSSSNETTKSFKNWFYVKANYKTYFIQKGLYRLGMQLESVYSTQPFFENYTASIISSHAFQPIPDSKTGFYNDFRANKYFGGGLMNIFTLKDKVDLRVEAYIFQPIYRILGNEDGIPYEGDLFSNRFGIASASLIYHSVVGPIRATVNYFDSQSQLKPLSFQLSLGYIIFNEHGLK